MKKILLVFAHRNEAKAILEAYPTKPVTDHTFQLTDVFNLNEHYDLLITGEGPLNVMLKLTHYLSLYHQNIEYIINYGVAGSLSVQFAIEQIVEINNCLCFDGTSFRFHNFQLETNQKSSHMPTCISLDKRINHIEIKKMLSYHGQIIDRELWAINFVAKNFKLKVKSHKVISDELDQVDICQMVKDQSDIYAHIIYNHFKQLNFDKSTEEKSNHQFPSELYLTHSMRAKLDKVLDSLSSKFKLSKDEILADELNKISFQKDMPAKERSLLVIDNLEKKLNPMRTKLELELREILVDLKRNNIQYKTDREWEKCYVEITTRLHNQDDIDQVISSLKKLNFEKVQHLFQGKTLNV
jgi:hypothetical protein